MDSLYQDLLNKKILVRESEFVPIYAVNWTAADSYQRP